MTKKQCIELVRKKGKLKEFEENNGCSLDEYLDKQETEFGYLWSRFGYF